MVEIRGSSCDDSAVRRELVLVVDDHPAFRRLARRLLERGGFAVAEAATGAEALRDAERLRPDLVLLDIQLPDRDGFSVAGSLKALTDPCPVVLTSSREAADYGDRIRSSDAIAFVPKTELSASVLRDLLAGR
jgi:CheY-like chemotaxis protein